MRDFESSTLALVLAAACLFGSLDALSAGQIDVRGTITHLSRTEGEDRDKVLGRVFIEGAKEPDTQYEKASVMIRAETKLFVKRGKERKSTEFATLKEGQKVEASFSGPVAESYPVQATAAEITIIEE